MATAGGGISVFARTAGNKYKITRLRPQDGLKSDRINALYADGNDNIWAATAGSGLDKITPKTDGTFHIQNFGVQEGLKGLFLRSITADKAGKLYLGSSDAGILVFNGMTFETINRNTGLSSNNIYSLIFDLEDRLWAGTEKGLDRITFNKDGSIVNIKHYGKAEGFTGIETIQNSVCVDREGHIWFGSVKSATRYLPENDKELKLPGILLSGINLFFDPIQQTPFSHFVKPWNFVPDNFTLPYNKNHLSFQLTALEHSNPEAIRYRWKLNGFDDDWSPPTSRNEAVYSNLPPGNYVLQVKAANENEVWSERSVCSFIILPPFWKTWWFSLLTGSTFLLFSFIAYQLRKRSLEKENRIERRRLEVERQLIELEQKALRLQMNPHFLFNCLNSIKGLIAEEKSSEAKIYLSKFSKLMRSMLENSRESFITLEEEINYLKNYVELEKLSISENLVFEIRTNIPEELSTFLIPPMLLQPFIENAIVHGISPKKGEGKILLILEKYPNHLLCIIEDDGVGIAASSNRNEHLRQAHKSTAIEVTRDRLIILHKKHYFPESDLILKNLRNELNEPAGTRAELKIPYKTL